MHFTVTPVRSRHFKIEQSIPLAFLWGWSNSLESTADVVHQIFRMLQNVLSLKMTLAMKIQTTKLIATIQTKMMTVRSKFIHLRKRDLCWSRILISSHSEFSPRIISDSDFYQFHLHSSFIRVREMTKLFDRKAYNKIHRKLKTSAVRPSLS